MTGMTINPVCVGITTPAPTTFPTTNIAGHNMVKIPGGSTVVGSAGFKDNPPRWVSLPQSFMSETVTSRSQYLEVMGEEGMDKEWDMFLPRGTDLTMQPVHCRHGNVVEYLKRRGNGLGLPPEEHWENANRGPAVKILEELRKDKTFGYHAEALPFFVENRFENFVFEVGGKIFTNVGDEIFREAMREGRPFYGWRVYGTDSGLLKDVCYNENTNPAYEDSFSGPVAVDWGRRNAYGLYNMTGNVWERVQPLSVGDVDPATSGGWPLRVLRGGSWEGTKSEELHAAYRWFDHPITRDESVGFRVWASEGSAR